MKRLTILVFLLSFIIPSSPSHAGLFDAWDNKAKITFVGYDRDETLTNFPVLVVLSEIGIAGFEYDDFLSLTNQDLRFADASEAVELNYEIDDWDTNGASYVWVAVDALTNSSCIYAYWGKSGETAPTYSTNGATFSNGYVGVWHLEESGDSTADEFKDSTPTGNHGQGGGTHGASYVPTRVSPGKIAAANDFDVSGDWVDVADNASLDITDKITISGWVYVENSKSGGQNQYMIDKQNRYLMVVRDDETIRYYATGPSPGIVDSTDTIALNTWHHIAATYDKDAGTNNAKVFIDGRVNGQATVTGSIGTDNNPVRLGMYSNGGGAGPTANWTFDGNMDEVRLSDVARSTNWMFATWLNMASNDVFQTYGGAVSAAPTISTLDATNVTSSSAFLNGNLISTGTSATALWIFYGTTDATTNKSGWMSSVLVEANATAGNKTHLATGLSTSTDYYYRYFASNSSAQAWGFTKSFRTQVDASQWSKDMKITFTGYDRGENLVNFPVLVVLSESGLTGFDYDDFLSPPHHDLRFTDESGAVELSYEIDDWDTNGTSYVWVAVDALTNNGCIYAYWGNSGEIAPAYTTSGTTFSNGYVGVWHLEESGDGTVDEFKDSTPAGNHGRGGGTHGASYVPTRVSPGKIAAANDFDVSGDWVDVADHASLDITDKITISGWVYIENSKPSGNHYLLDKQNRYAMFVRPDETIWFYATGPSPGIVQTTDALSTNTWHHIATTYDQVGGVNNAKVFIDGRVSVQATVTGSMAEDDNVLRLGTYANGGGAAASSSWTFDGNMDEVRLSDVARSTNWMFATWLNMASNDVFQTYGAVGAEFVHPGTVISVK